MNVVLGETWKRGLTEWDKGWEGELLGGEREVRRVGGLEAAWDQEEEKEKELGKKGPTVRTGGREKGGSGDRAER